MATADAGLLTTRSEDDLQQVAALQRRPPSTVIISSDLHLGEGLNPVDGRTVLTENFLQDGAFSRMIDHHIADVAARQAGDPAIGPALLVLNGDIIDFPRVTTVPQGPEALAQWRALLATLGCHKTDRELRDSISRREVRFGLRTHDFKAAWKLDRVVRGHHVFFQALARWVSAGHHLLYIKGNHDVEIEHPLVRRAFRQAVVDAGSAQSDCGLTVDQAGAYVAFEMRGIELHNAWIEHGHQFEAMTRVSGPAFLDSRPGELNQPIGTFINRYLLNPIEHMRPFLNNIKPVEGVLWRLLKYHPVRALGAAFRASWFVPRALAMNRFRQLLGVVMFLVFVIGGWAVGAGLLAALVGIATGAWSPFGESSVRVLTIIALAALATPVAVGVLRDLLTRFRGRRVSPYVADCVAAIPATVHDDVAQLVYVIVGHTHHQDSQRFEWEGAGRVPVLYLNTGTWIPIWSEDRPDLHGRSLRPFVRLTLNGARYTHEHLQWDDAAGRPEPSIVLAGLL